MTVAATVLIAATEIPAIALKGDLPTSVGLLQLGAEPAVQLLGGEVTAEAAAATVLAVRAGATPIGFIHAPLNITDLQPGEVSEFAREALGGASTVESNDRRPRRVDAPVTVIVPTGGRSRQLQRCLESLAAIPRADLEFIVVNNSPGDTGTREVVKRIADRDPRFRYFEESRPGSSIARNRGLAEASGDLVAFTDDDVVVDGEWLDWLLDPFDDPAVQATTGMVLPLELITGAQKSFERFAGFSKGLERREYSLSAENDHEAPFFPFWGAVFGSGNSMAFRRTGLVRRHGFDPSLGAGSVALAGSDVEAMSAAILDGGALVYEPRSICWHEHRRDGGSLERQMFNYGVGCGAICTKYLSTDMRFLTAFAKTVARALVGRARLSQASAERVADRRKPLRQAFAKGLACGPIYYVRSKRWSRQLKLGEVINGR
ncbi:MAG: glycosyltransferase [Solirubrobacterales bacterium]